MPATKTTASPYLKRLLSERAAHVAVVESVQGTAHSENRALTDDERTALRKRAADIAAIDADLQLAADFAQGAAKYANLIGAQAEAEEQHERAYRTSDAPAAQTPTNQRAAFADAFAKIASEYVEHPRGTSRSATLPSPGSMEYRAAIMLSGLTDQPSQLVSAVSPTLPLRLLDLFGRTVVSSGKVDVLTMSQATGATVVAEGELKPEATMTIDVEGQTLDTVAFYKIVSRQALEDIPQLQSLLTDRLLAGLRNKLEALAVAEISGSTDIGTADGPDWASAIRLGIAGVQSLGYVPSAVIMSPSDAAAVDVQALGFPGAGMTPGSPWGVPIVPSASVVDGTAYVGDWRAGVSWFDRGNTDAYLSDSHADVFLRNQFVVLAEARALFAVVDPSAVVGVTVVTAP